jgi:ribosome-binding protein aMBF1 (putative translation factor)
MRFQKYTKKDKKESSDWEFDVALLVLEARLHAGLTQKELAKKMGTQQPSIARVESGKLLPSLEFLKKLAKAVKTQLILPSFAFIKGDHGQPSTPIESIAPSPYFALKSDSATYSKIIN